MPKVGQPKTSHRKPRSGTNINVSQADGEFIRLFINSELVAEVFGNRAQTARDWEEELRKARTLNALPEILRSFAKRITTIHNREDHNFPKPDQKVVAFLMGFTDGLLGIDQPHPANKDFTGLNLRMQRDHSPSFSEGFEVGDCVRRIVKGTN